MALLKWIQLRKLTPLSELIAGLDQAGGPRPAARGTATDGRGAAPPPAPGPRPPAHVQPSGGRSERVEAPGSPPPAPPAELKPALLGAIREQNKTFYGVVIAQAQRVEVEGDTVTFTFAPLHKMLRAQLEQKRGWLETLAQSVSGRRIKVAARESQPAPAAPADDPAAQRQADLRARAQSEPTVQAVLDVFGGEIEDVEEIK
jgi:hypothetical protein